MPYTKIVLLAVLIFSLALSGCKTTSRSKRVSSYEEVAPRKQATQYNVTKTASRRIATIPYVYKNERFVWPVRGSVIAGFGQMVAKTSNKGIDIKADVGEDVVASRSGRVVFCDDKMKGFGKTVILDHGNNLQTVYAYNSDILVRVGDVVRQREVIARAGKTGRASEASLHFEIRKSGEAVNPMSYLTR